jgi:hypothetical protein
MLIPAAREAKADNKKLTKANSTIGTKATIIFSSFEILIKLFP